MKWLTEEIATGSYNEVSKKVLDPDAVILDVRDLVDKSGNDVDYVKSRIVEGISILKKIKNLLSVATMDFREVIRLPLG